MKLRLMLCYCLFVLAWYFVPRAAAQLSRSEQVRFHETTELLQKIDLCLNSDSEAKTLQKGLLGAWRKDKPLQAPPDAYIRSLREKLSACKAAQKMRPGKQKDDLLQAIRYDLVLKEKDCRAYGMGRLITVTVNPLRDGHIQTGWQVFYKWSTTSSITVQEQRAPNLAGPATISVPPGIYEFRGEKNLGAGKTDETNTARIEVIGVVDVSLVVQ